VSWILAAETDMFNISLRSLILEKFVEVPVQLRDDKRSSEGVRQTGDKRSVTFPVKDMGRTTSYANRRDVLDRIVLLSVLLFAFWATAWIFLVGFGGYYFNRTSYHPVGVNFQLVRDRYTRT
jgi:hypothetical protein